MIAYDARVVRHLRSVAGSEPRAASASAARSLVVAGLSRPVVLVVLVGLVGCAGRAPAPREGTPPPSHRAHDAILEDEVLIEDLRVTLGDDSLGCPDRCRASASICEAADRICAVVSELRDVSLAPRCDRARASCREATRTVSSCGCTPPSTP